MNKMQMEKEIVRLESLLRGAAKAAVAMYKTIDKLTAALLHIQNVRKKLKR